MCVKMEIEVDSVPQVCQILNSDLNRERCSDLQANPDLSPERSWDQQVNPDSIQILPPFNTDDCYLCLDCNNKLLFDSDQLSDHCEHFPDHGNINPLCVYNSFSLSLQDFCKSCCNFNSVDRELIENSGAIRTGKRKADSDQTLEQRPLKQTVEQPRLKLTISRAVSGEFQLNAAGI